MKKTLQLLLLLCIAFFSTSGYTQNFIQDALTLKLAFGEDNLPDEFLIARPQRLIVDEKGRIYVFDERFVKIYDENGKPLKIIGGPGQGPGEFDSIIINLYLSSGGYLIAQEMSSYNLFSPEHEFIEKRQFRTLPYYDSLINEYKVEMRSWNNKFYSLNEKEFVISADNLNAKNYNEEGNYFHYLFYANDDKLLEIVSYKKVNAVAAKRERSFGTVTLEELGTFYYSIIPGDRIIYTHSGWDSIIRSGMGYLTFYVVNKDGSGKKTFEWMYTPEKIEKSYIDNYEIGMSLNNEKPKEIENGIKKMLREKKYKAPMSNIYNDGAALFISTLRKEGDLWFYDIDVVDFESGIYLSSFTINFYPSYFKNGFLYRIFSGSDEEFARIEKYKINPAVYGR